MTDTRRAIDAASAALRRQIKPLYMQAGKDLRAALEKHLVAYEAQLAALLAQLDSGEITKSEYINRVEALVTTGKAWKELRMAMAVRMYDANRAATAAVNAALPAAYADSASRAAFRMEKQARRQVGLVPCTPEDVQAMADDGELNLHQRRIHRGKDVRWNEKRIASSLLAGVALGYGAAKICDYVSQRVSSGGYSAMGIYADTSIGGAYASGQADAMEDAEECGLKTEKTWIATLDHRTRDTHQELDGQTIPIDEPFVTVNGKIRFPLDPLAPPEEIYNCRCSMIEHVTGFKLPSIRRENIRNEDGVKPIVNATTYREWKAMKEQQAGGPEALAAQWRELRRKGK